MRQAVEVRGLLEASWGSGEVGLEAGSGRWEGAAVASSGLQQQHGGGAVESLEAGRQQWGPAGKRCPLNWSGA